MDSLACGRAVVTGRIEPKTVRSPFDERAGRERDLVLDGLRGVAVLAVIAGHAVNFRFYAASGDVFARFRGISGSMAITGVEIFFLISGYVITRLLTSEIRNFGSIDFKGFYFRRVMRIIPPFGIYLLTIFYLAHQGYIEARPREIAAAGTFTCNTGLINCSWFVGHSWSLAVEEQFYLVWPLLLSFTPQRYITSLLGLFAALLISISFYRGNIPFSNDTSFVFIAIGALTASSFPIQRMIISHVNITRWLATAAVFLAATLYAPDPAMAILKPLLLMILVFGAGSARLAASLLTSKPFQVVGSCSYSLYLWQQLFFAALMPITHRQHRYGCCQWSSGLAGSLSKGRALPSGAVWVGERQYTHQGIDLIPAPWVRPHERDATGAAQHDEQGQGDVLADHVTARPLIR